MTSAIPDTGTTWKAGGFGDVDNRFNARGGLAAALIRDNRGLQSDISPYKIPSGGGAPVENWSPFAADGQLRADLFAWVRDGGVWVPNPLPNEGFHLIGAFDDRGGPERRPNVRHDDQMVLQSIFPFDSDLTQVGMVIQFTGVEVTKALLRRLRMGLPLTDPAGNSIVEMPGVPTVTSRPVDADSTDYQLVLLFARRKSGKFVYTAEGYPLVRESDIGNYRRDKTAADAPSLGFTVLPDPNHVDIDPTDPSTNELVPCLYSEWVAGDGWTAIGGSPVFPGLAPQVDATGPTTAAVFFDETVGGGDTTTYTAEKFQAGAWTAATIAAAHTDEPVEGAMQLDITGLAAGTAKFRVTAHGSNGSNTVSRETNTVTLTG